MASEASVADHTPDRHVEEKEVPATKNVEHEVAQPVAEIGDKCDNGGETAPVIEEKKDEILKDSGHETLVCSNEKNGKSDVPKPVGPSIEAAENSLETPTVDVTEPPNPSETPTVDVTELPNPLETPTLESPEPPNPSKTPTVDAAEPPNPSEAPTVDTAVLLNLSETPTVDATEPSNPETGNMVKESELVESGTKIGESSDKHIELAIEKDDGAKDAVVEDSLKQGDANTPVAEPTIEVEEKASGEQPIVTTESACEAAELLIDKNSEPTPIAEQVKEIERVPEFGKLPGNQPTDTHEQEKLINGPEKTSVPELVKEVEKVPEVLESAIETVESQEKVDENPNGTTTASEIVRKQEVEPVTAVAVESKTDVGGGEDDKKFESSNHAEEEKRVDNQKPETKVDAEVNIAGDKSIETETPACSEAVVSGTAKGEELSQGSGKFDLGTTAIENALEAKEIEKGIAAIEGLAKDEGESGNVIHEAEKIFKKLVPEPVEDDEQKEGKDSGSDLNLASTAIEVLAKETIVDPCAASNVTADDQFEAHIASVPIESVIKEAVVGSGDDVSREVETVVTEVAKVTEAPIEELVTQTASLVVGDEKMATDGTDSVQTVVKEVIKCASAVSDVAEKPTEEKTEEESKDVSEVDDKQDTSVNAEAVDKSITDDDLKREDGKKDGTEEIHARDLAELSKDAIDSKPEVEAPKVEIPIKTRSPNMISKVKHTLVKAKKAIFGKSPSSKTVSSDTKG